MNRTRHLRPSATSRPAIAAAILLAILAVWVVASPSRAPRAEAQPPGPAQYLPIIEYGVQPTPTPRPTATATPRPPATGTPQPTPGPGTMAQVVHIVDGDTIDVRISGATLRVRYIGIDTPEMDTPCGSLAKQANARLVEGKSVWLVKDVSETDRFGRLLRYVYVNNLLVNGDLVVNGWAIAKRYPPDTALAPYLEYLQSIATGGCIQATPIPSPTPTGQAPNCAAEYPTVCIPPPPPDLDCKDISFRRFTVLPPDRHRFDGDGNGIGCESD